MQHCEQDAAQSDSGAFRFIETCSLLECRLLRAGLELRHVALVMSTWPLRPSYRDMHVSVHAHMYTYLYAHMRTHIRSIDEPHLNA